MAANETKLSRVRSITEFAVSSIILVFFLIVTIRCFASPSELLEETIFTGFSESTKIIFARVMLIAANVLGLFFCIRSLRTILALRRKEESR